MRHACYHSCHGLSQVHPPNHDLWSSANCATRIKDNLSYKSSRNSCVSKANLRHFCARASADKLHPGRKNSAHSTLNDAVDCTQSWAAGSRDMYDKCVTNISEYVLPICKEQKRHYRVIFTLRRHIGGLTVNNE